MQYATYIYTGDLKAPAVVSINGGSTPVWHQNRWDTGEYAQYIRNNGCGHCCTAMAARLHGVELDPMAEYLYCRKTWGAPQENGSPVQHHFATTGGIVKVLRAHGIPAEAFGVPSDGLDAVMAHIGDALSQGKQVIFWSEPTPEFPDNPFSKGAHYVMAVGYDQDGKIVVANSSEKPWCKDGIQLVEPEIIARALYKGSCPGDLTWGEPEHFEQCAGYVVVGRTRTSVPVYSQSRTGKFVQQVAFLD